MGFNTRAICTSDTMTSSPLELLIGTLLYIVWLGSISIFRVELLAKITKHPDRDKESDKLNLLLATKPKLF